MVLSFIYGLNIDIISRLQQKLSVSFWLDVPLIELIKRLRKNSQRPLLFKKNISESVKKIYFERKRFYSEADYKIDCNLLKSDEIVDKVIKLYEKKRNKI